MRTCLLALAVVATVAVVAPPVSSQDVTGDGPYDVADGWPKPFAEDGYGWGSHAGVFAESPNRIFVVQSGEIEVPNPLPSGWEGFVGSIGIDARNPGDAARVVRNCIFVVDGDGNLLEAWTQWDRLYEGTNGPHRVRLSPYDPERRVFVVHEEGHAVHVFSNDGTELLMTLGEPGVSGADESHFDQPQDVAFLEDGSILVADGINNSRVVMFDANGGYITDFGKRGTGRGEFDGLHSIVTDSIGRIYVTDAGNHRIQVFNQTTRAAAWYHPNISPVATWPGFDQPTDIVISGYDVWIVENGPTRLVKLDSNGNEQFRWEAPGDGPGGFGELHQLSVDIDGNVYGADSALGRTVKLVPKADADFRQLVRPDDDLMIK